MSASTTINFTFDATGAAWISELARLLRLFTEVSDKPVHLVELVGSFTGSGIRSDLNLVTTRGAGEQRITLEPGERLQNLMTALRTWDGKGNFVAETGHDSHSIGGNPRSVA